MKPLEAYRLMNRAFRSIRHWDGARSSCRGEWSRMKNFTVAERIERRIERLQKVYDRAKAVWDQWQLKPGGWPKAES